MTKKHIITNTSLGLMKDANIDNSFKISIYNHIAQTSHLYRNSIQHTFQMKKISLSMRHLLSASSNNFEFRNYIAIVIFVNTEVIIILEKFGKYVDL